MREWNRNNPDKVRARRQRSKAQLTPQQRDRQNERVREWRARDPRKAADVQKRYRERLGEDGRRDRRLRREYGLTLEAFRALLAGQGGRCAICKTDKPIKGKGWCVDHDHSTGAVRGVLCHLCNVGIGALQDDPTVVSAAAFYLMKAG
jgi:hypothetical protein